MMKVMFKQPVAWFMMAGIAISSVLAQPSNRPDDHFWRKKVVDRIPLGEKINTPLVNHEGGYYAPNEQFTQLKGMVVSLVEGLQTGTYKAYDPDDWNKTYNYEELVARMQEFEDALSAGQGYDDMDESSFEVPDSNVVDEWADDWNFEDPSAEASQDDGFGTPAGTNVIQNQNQTETPLEYGNFEQVIHIIEDRVFDKIRSQMIFQIEFVEIIWQDPTGALPERVLARFKFSEVRPQLEHTAWKNRFNDAEVRSIAEVLDLRLFHSFLINVGGEPVRTLAEAERRRQEMIEFEHHLWQY
jgi:hypothetical protein